LLTRSSNGLDIDDVLPGANLPVAFPPLNVNRGRGKHHFWGFRIGVLSSKEHSEKQSLAPDITFSFDAAPYP